MWAYFDTSALVKRYVDEPGRADVVRLLRDFDVVTSAIAPVELRSAFRRRSADRSLSPAAAAAVLKRVTADRAFWIMVDVTGTVLDGAEKLVARLQLRTLDAIHVASAQLFAARMNLPAVDFVSADHRQIEGAHGLGLTARLIGGG